MRDMHVFTRTMRWCITCTYPYARVIAQIATQARQAALRALYEQNQMRDAAAAAVSNQDRPTSPGTELRVNVTVVASHAYQVRV